MFLLVKIFIVSLVLLNIILINMLFEANGIVNWYINYFNSKPCITSPPKRSRLHRWLLHFFTFPVLHHRHRLKKVS